MSATAFTVVIPTIGRPSLATTLAALADARGPQPDEVLLVDDRHAPTDQLPLEWIPEALRDRLRFLSGRAAGPAAARNVGWRAARSPWVAFLDDDVVPARTWLADLAADLATARPAAAGVQGGIVVPLPRDRPPTDWERNVAALELAQWATADMAVRRAALAAVGGFDERFPTAYREDADLALRFLDAGWELQSGRRVVAHPAAPAPWFQSIRLQENNRADPLMVALHGRDWRQRASAPPGRRHRHLAATSAALLAAGALALRRRRTAIAAASAWLVGTAEFAWSRIAPGPRTVGEVATMVATSVAIPPVASWHWLGALLARRRRLGRPAPRPERPAAVLFDRDGTLVHDVPYNGDPGQVELVDGAAVALRRLRDAGIPIGMITNQSGIARGLLTRVAAEAVNRRIDELAGPFDVVVLCPHAPEDACSCRKPQPGMVLEAARRLGVPPARCAVVGDIGSDVHAAIAAAARPVLVPAKATLPEEITAAPEVAADITAAVDALLGAME